MPSDAVNRATRRDWRELGFYYDRDAETRVWRLTGLRAGPLAFKEALLSYVADPANATNSEPSRAILVTVGNQVGYAFGPAPFVAGVPCSCDSNSSGG